MKLRLLCPFIVLAGLSPLCLAEWEFFAMDTGTRDSQTRSYDQQAALVKELGFSGIGYTGANHIPEMLAATTDAAPLRRIGEPDEIAGAAVFLASPAGRFVTGQALVVDGGVTIAR